MTNSIQMLRKDSEGDGESKTTKPENATDEKTWYVKDAHGDTMQLTDGNKTALSNKQMQTGFGELRDELHQIVRIA